MQTAIRFLSPSLRPGVTALLLPELVCELGHLVGLFIPITWRALLLSSLSNL